MDPSPGASWAATGLTPLAGQVLEYLVGHPDSGERTVAAAVGATAEDTRLTLASLEADLLAVRVDGTPAGAGVEGPPSRWRASPPRSSLGSLLARRRQDLARAELYTERLHELYRAAAHRYVDSDLFEVLETPAEVATRYAHLLRTAREEVLHLAKPPYVTSVPVPRDGEGRPGPAAELVWGEEVRLRSVYDSDGFTDAVSLETALRGTSRGGELRLAPDVPMKLAVFDRTAAIMPLGGADPAGGSLVVHSPPLLEVLTALFENIWHRAVPVSLGPHPPAPDDRTSPAADRAAVRASALGGPDERTREILLLLSAGMKDEAVARVLHLSRRTVQKHISDAAKTLGARTRFQIALLARDRGWLHPGQDT
ncbi:helix-turn-helix transcriptional regulator [Sphaerisporangium sp. NPDC005289]|uniref:helix-turn-helix transcriptional regulator n=1 Tax=Sphaerisporangium sp. NPDC005289 TaxID=3155247 RepID=UPI0033A1C8C9